MRVECPERAQRVEGLVLLGIRGRIKARMSSSGPFFVYIVTCADNTYYVGHTEDLQARISAHNDRRGASWTGARRLVRLVYYESFPTELEAVQRERQLKRWSREKKEALIRGDKQALKQFSRCQGLHGRPDLTGNRAGRPEP